MGEEVNTEGQGGGINNTKGVWKVKGIIILYLP